MPEKEHKLAAKLLDESAPSWWPDKCSGDSSPKERKGKERKGKKLKLTINTNQVKCWFLRRGETGVPGENLSVQSREPTNSTHI